MCRCEDLDLEINRDIIRLNAPAPINLLSDDVLRHIFKFHCKDPVTWPIDRVQWPTTAPQIALSHVCSAWREIVLDMPTFWTNVRIAQRRPNAPKTLATVIKAANKWLSRAKDLPCFIEIDFTEAVETWTSNRLLWDQDWHKNIVRDLISLHKFKKLHVTFADDYLRDLLQLPSDKLSCIEDLHIRYISSYDDDTKSPLDFHKLSGLTAFSLLPDPFDLYLLGDPSRGHDRFIDIPWRNLRHIRLHATVPTPFCFHALQHSASILETCSLDITHDDTFDNYAFKSSRGVPVHLPRLRRLKVTISSLYKGIEFLESFLLSLRFPNLKSLILGSLDDPGLTIDLEMLLKVQNASKMHLEELVISEFTVGIDVRSLLISFPLLRRLELSNGVTFTSDTMIDVGKGYIGIYLEDLVINDPCLDFERLLQMVKARSRVGDPDTKHRVEVARFKYVTLHYKEPEDKVEKETRDTIQEIKQSGVDLTVVFATYSVEESGQDSLYGTYSGASSYDDELVVYDFAW